MSDKNDGGSAYPRPIKAVGMGSFSDGAFDEYGIECDEGMSLRDWFAGMALQGILSMGNDYSYISDEGKKIPDIASEDAYAFADAILTERNKERDQ